MFQNLRLLGATVTAVLAGTFVVPASPANADSSCSRGNHCGWDVGFNSGKVSFFNSDDDFRNNTFSTGAIVDNNIKSAKNRTSTNYVSYYFYGIWYTDGVVFCVNPGSQVENLPDDGVPDNYQGQANEASSLLMLPNGYDPGCY